jgi:RNA polymerase sigma-70 factor (ECF subfamily)
MLASRLAERFAADNTASEVELAAALDGDAEAFRRLTDRYTRELHVHCYRMLGSFHDAEDAVQESMLRAWRHLGTFANRSTFRAWLYRIATNVCLSRGPRQPADRPLRQPIAEAVARATEPAINLSPYPDALLDELSGESRAKPWGELEATSGDPAAEYDLRESVQLAFLAAVQLLPPRQRAVLILRDVLGWSAAEVADILDATTAGVNNALHRARATMAQQRAAGRLQSSRIVPTDEVEQSLVRRYVEAWQACDIRGLAGLLKHDVVLTMPPLPLRYTGRAAVTTFYAAVPFAGLDRLSFISTRANRQPAVAVYRFDPDRRMYHALGIFVLRADGDVIAEITAFIDPTLLAVFGLPTEFQDRTKPGAQSS